MEITSGSTKTSARPKTAFLRLLVALGALACCGPHFVTGSEHHNARHTRAYFKHEMAVQVRADHPAILPVAAAIRAVTTDPLQQIVMVNDVTHLLVDYDDDERVYGRDEFHATFEEMLARRREAGWLYLRDDCDGRAVFAAHLLASLGIPFRLEASYWKEHAWVVATVNGKDYDLLDLRRNAPETDKFSYRLIGKHFVRPSVQPPMFAWRKAWAQRTQRDLVIGLRLGLLALDSTPKYQHERYATDWTSKSPGKTEAFDDRAPLAMIAGFPYGEPLRVEALASHSPAAPASTGPALGVTTGSDSSAPIETTFAATKIHAGRK